ncbi:MAG: GNAT family N-acetyltransferase [Litoreibacter sp.]|nr:GNAT family N-acetyltransferase [Litoreibacter sp.]MCY4335702.1 GNAT family N-acetyltransferase [Litoreibacter sp.]
MSEILEITQPVIKTDGFILRPVSAADAGALTLHASDKRVAQNTTTIPHPLPEGATEAFISRCQAPDRTEDVWVIDPSVDGSELIGAIALQRMDRDQSEIGYWIAPAFWNSGIASQAVAALIAANPQICRTIFGSVFQDNPASARVLTNCGFDYIGEAESFSVARGATVPTWTYIKALD